MKYSFELIDQIMFELDRNKSIHEIARKYGISRPTVTRLKAQDGANYEKWKLEKLVMDSYRWRMRDYETINPGTQNYDPHVFKFRARANN